jgi:Domain of unknown function (DUF5658)
MAITEIFVYLQLLDLLTTLVGFRLGALEASPFVRSLMHFGPGVGLAASKALALGLGGFCVYTRRHHLMRLANYWYSALVVWNLMIILVLAMAMHPGQ